MRDYFILLLQLFLLITSFHFWRAVSSSNSRTISSLFFFLFRLERTLLLIAGLCWFFSLIWLSTVISCLIHHVSITVSCWSRHLQTFSLVCWISARCFCLDSSIADCLQLTSWTSCDFLLVFLQNLSLFPVNPFSLFGCQEVGWVDASDRSN